MLEDTADKFIVIALLSLVYIDTWQEKLEEPLEKLRGVLRRESLVGTGLTKESGF
jgi:hypothetical protein